MKKKYIEPQAQVITIEVASVICTSSMSLGGNASSNGVTSGDSRAYGFDDDEY